MGYWEISKEFEFDYGHRVWTQSLNTHYSIDNACVCRHLHGHRGKVIVYLSGDSLNSQGMITDFKHLNWFKKWIDSVLDHKFIMDFNDPLLFHEIPEAPPQGAMNNDFYDINFNEDYATIQPDVYKDKDPCVIEKYQGMVFVDFVPTSENLSEWIFSIVSKKMKEINVKVSKIEFYETPKSKSTYIGVK